MWEMVIFISSILFIIIIFFILSYKHKKGDYGDGGGHQVGGEEHISFFAPRNDKAGMWGERIVNYHLRLLLRNDEYLLANILLPLNNGYSTEIDCVLITRKGIFCIETKKWVGHIFGNDEDEYWIQQYDDPRMNDRQHKNPVKQNKDHCALLERKLNNKFPVVNIVIFANLEDRRFINSQYTFTVREFRNYYRKLNDDEIEESSLSYIYQRLLPYVATKEQLEQHRKEVKQRYHDY